MARLAWFSPLPPARTGVAIYSDEVVRELRDEHQIDVFVGEPAGVQGAGPESAGRSAHDFVWLHRSQPYDLTVFQLGNSSAHDYAWPYLFRYPGLVVLHDAHLHHARASVLLRLSRAADYRAEFVANHPGVKGDVAELAVAGFDTHLYYRWPMNRVVALASRMTAVHARLTAEALSRMPEAPPVETIRMAHGRRISTEQAAEATRRIRARHQIRADAVIFAVFGGLTPEKRIPQVISAFAELLPYAPHARLMLVGEPVPYCDVGLIVEALAIADHVIVTGYVDNDQAFDDYIGAADVSVNLRWPTAREVSGPWVRALAAGRPTITMDLAHTADVVGLDPRTWTVVHAAASEGGAPDPVTVRVDVVDEAHSLRLAMRRLGTDAELRQRLGRAAAVYWEREHSMEVMLEDYRRVIARAMTAPFPAAAIPPHLRADGSEHLGALLDGFGVGADVWSRI